MPKAFKELEDVGVENGSLDLGIKRFLKRLDRRRFSSDESENHLYSEAVVGWWKKMARREDRTSKTGLTSR